MGSYTVWAVDKNGHEGIFVSDVESPTQADKIAKGLGEYDIKAWVEED